MSALRTINERYEIKRLAERARGGLSTAEKQALAFVAEAQLMRDGVCRKALTKGADVGYSKRNLQWGLHGKRRNGKLEYMGLLARRIVFVAGGYPKGGRALGGQGLTPDYDINLEVLMTFIPEIDDETPETPEPPKKGETKDETLGDTSPKKGETLEKKGETKGDLMHTSSLSSSLAVSPRPVERRGVQASQVPERTQQPRLSTEEAQATAVVVDGPPSEKSKAAGMEIQEPPVAHQAAPESSIQIFPAGESESEATPKFSDPIVDAERRQADRHLTNSQICDEFKSIFDRLNQQEVARDNYRRLDTRVPNPAFDWAVLDAMPKGIDLTWKRPLPKHQRLAAEYFRAVGRDVALAKWGEFLLDGDHQVSQPLGDDPETGKSCGFDTVQQDWLLYIFVNEQMATGVAEASQP
jgi:hypothetical protein